MGNEKGHNTSMALAHSPSVVAEVKLFKFKRYAAAGWPKHGIRVFFDREWNACMRVMLRFMFSMACLQHGSRSKYTKCGMNEHPYLHCMSGALLEEGIVGCTVRGKKVNMLRGGSWFMACQREKRKPSFWFSFFQTNTSNSNLSSEVDQKLLEGDWRVIRTEWTGTRWLRLFWLLYGGNGGLFAIAISSITSPLSLEDRFRTVTRSFALSIIYWF